MTDSEQARFGPGEVIQIASKLATSDSALLIGGQATALWAWLYRGRDPALPAAKEITSKDIDYFGPAVAAESFAAAVGGEVRRPSPDDMNTPNTAIVVASFNGKPLVVDFLNGVKGVTRRELESGAAIIEVAAELEGVEVRAQVRVLHPILCLKSRIANMLDPLLMRRDAFAWEQLHAAVAVTRLHINDALQDGDWAEAKACLSELFKYVRSDRFGKSALQELGVDLLDILRSFQDDERIDPRYRKLTLAKMIERIETARNPKP